jgi:hypothetical protein
VREAIDAVASARTAASLDPEGEALAKCLAGFLQAPAHAIAAEWIAPRRNQAAAPSLVL